MKYYIYTSLVSALIGAAIVWFLFPKHETEIKTETKTVTEYKSRTVERWVKRPDGTEEGERIIDEVGKQKSKSETEVKIDKKPDWAISFAIGTQIQELTPIYTIRIDRRIAGPVFAGVYGSTDGQVGLGLTLEF